MHQRTEATGSHIPTKYEGFSTSISDIVIEEGAVVGTHLSDSLMGIFIRDSSNGRF